MAMKTSHLLGLLTLGFIMLLIGWPWWLGVGLIVLSMAIAMSGESSEGPVLVPMPIGAPGQVAAAGMPAQAPQQAEPKYFDDYGEAPPDWEFPDITKDLNLKVSTPSDAIGDMTTMKDPYHDGVGHVGAVGARSGTFTLDPNEIIRFKDDFRIKIDQMHKASGLPDSEAPGGGEMGWLKNAHTFRIYYRTSPKRAWPRRTALQWGEPPKDQR